MVVSGFAMRCPEAASASDDADFCKPCSKTAHRREHSGDYSAQTDRLHSRPGNSTVLTASLIFLKEAHEGSMGNREAGWAILDRDGARSKVRVLTNCAHKQGYFTRQTVSSRRNEIVSIERVPPRLPRCDICSSARQRRCDHVLMCQLHCRRISVQSHKRMSRVTSSDVFHHGSAVSGSDCACCCR
jgi:hypothetical protein